MLTILGSIADTIGWEAMCGHVLTVILTNRNRALGGNVCIVMSNLFSFIMLIFLSQNFLVLSMKVVLLQRTQEDGSNGILF